MLCLGEKKACVAWTEQWEHWWRGRRWLGVEAVTTCRRLNHRRLVSR